MNNDAQSDLKRNVAITVATADIKRTQTGPRRLTKLQRHNLRWGLLFISP